MTPPTPHGEPKAVVGGKLVPADDAAAEALARSAPGSGPPQRTVLSEERLAEIRAMEFYECPAEVVAELLAYAERLRETLRATPCGCIKGRGPICGTEVTVFECARCVALGERPL